MKSDIKPLPSEAILCGIRYTIQAHEGIVIFEQSHCMFGCHTRLCFERASEPGGLWYLQSSSTWNRVSINHIVEAYKILCDVFGGSFESKQPVP